MDAKTQKVIAIRADASTRIGTGHVMRCLTLANKFKNNGSRVIFLCKQHSGHLIDYIKKQDFEVLPLSMPINNASEELNEQAWLGCDYQDDAIECLQRLDDSDIDNVDLLIVDHYSLDHQWQDLLRPRCKKIMVIDDLANRKHHCDILLDQTFGRAKEGYKSLAPEYCNLLLGKQYMLLRDEFDQARKLAQTQRENSRLSQKNQVLISLGGTDPDNIASTLIRWLISSKVNYDELNICLVANGNSSFLDELNILSKDHDWINIVINPPSMAKLMLNADIAIGTSGATAWERCCMGLPTLSIISADNQSLVSKNLESAGAIISLGYFKQLTEHTFKDAFDKLVNDKEHYQNMVQQSFECCDGLGAGKVARKVLQVMSNVELRPATIKDNEVTFKWQSNKSIRQYFNEPKIPTKTEHDCWFNNNLADPKSSLYIILNDKLPVGTLRLDEQGKHEFIISILVSPDVQGKGIALQTLNKIPQLVENGLFFADIHQDNINSIKLFKKAGFEPISPSRYRLQIKAHTKVTD